MRILKDDLDIVKELPPHLKSLDIEAIGSLVCCLLGFYIPLKSVFISQENLKPLTLPFLFC